MIFNFGDSRVSPFYIGCKGKQKTKYTQINWSLYVSRFKFFFWKKCSHLNLWICPILGIFYNETALVVVTIQYLVTH